MNTRSNRLAEQAGACRFVWNHFLSRQQQEYAAYQAGTRQRRLRVAVPNQRLQSRGHRSLMYLSVTAIISAVRRLIGSSVLLVE
ncbi:MAG: helix-turn-helix domain-containing protein [Caldilineaceae bacterium]|nr:helix-turn-helix domain-containing protein [Caldilineaceae bacterium]